MNRYSCIFNQIWKDKKFRQLDDSGQKLFIALITSPSSNMIGYYNWPLVYACHDLNGWSEEKFRKYASELERYGMAFYDYDAEIVFIPNFMRYNSINTIKQIVGAFNEIKGLPLSRLFNRLHEAWKTYIEKPYLEAARERLNEHPASSEKSISCQKAITSVEKIALEMVKMKETLTNTPIDNLSIGNPEKPESENPPIDTPIEKGIDKQEQKQEQEQEQEQEQKQEQKQENHADENTPIPDESPLPRRPAHKRPIEGVPYERQALQVIYEMLDYCPGYIPDAPSEIRLLQELEQEYPNVNLTAEFRKARDWLHESSPSQRPKSNLKKFLRNWISRAAKDYGPDKRRIIGYETVTEFVPVDETGGTRNEGHTTNTS